MKRSRHRPSRSRFDEIFRCRTPKGFSEAVDAAARMNHQTASEYVRRTILQALQQDGIRLDTAGKARPINSPH